MLIAAVFVAGCEAGSGEGLDENGRPLAGGGGPALVATFDSIQQNVLTPECTVCHAGANAPLGLRLDAANSFGLLVGVASVEVPSLLRVDPGRPDASYLIQKLEGTAAVGERMPLGGPPLPQPTIDVIRQWIAEGAMPARAFVRHTAPIRVQSVSPLPGSTLDGLPPAVIVMFDRPPDAATVNVATVSLERSGGDARFDDEGAGDGVAADRASGIAADVAIAAPVSVPEANPATAVLDLSGVAPVEDVYRLRLAGGGGALVLDHDGNALDGEFDGAFPSGDGVGGGDFQLVFTVGGVQPTLESIQKRVFDPRCADCHSGAGSAPPTLDLGDVHASFESLVGVASSERPGLLRVAPGDPEASYLLRKLEPDGAGPGHGTPAGQSLPAAELDAMHEWIARGAEW